MFSLRSVASIAAGVALVAGLTVAGTAPAQADNHVVLPASGTTAVTLDAPILEALDTVGVGLSVRRPASINASRGSVRFPVTGIVANSGAILHSGALVFTRGSVENGTVVLGQPTIRESNGHYFVTAKVVLGGTKIGRLEVFRVAKPRLRESGDDIIVKGIVHLTGTPGVAAAINETLGLDGVFVPGMRLGTVRAVITPGA